MKDSPQYFSGQQKTWNGGVMSAGSGGGGRREEGGRGGGGGGYPPWPPAHHPIHSHHHHLPSPPAPLPRMMGGYFGGRGVPAASAYTGGGGGWARPGGLKPPERWAPVVGSSTGGQAEGGMDLSQSRPNGGSQPNGVAKEPVSVIATNPLRTSGADKPLEPSDRSDDEDEDCMVIEEAEEAPRTGELPPHRLPARQQAPSIAVEAPALEAPPAHHNPPAAVRQEPPGRPEASHHLPQRLDPCHHLPQRTDPHHLPPQRQDPARPEMSHHLPPSVSQPHRSDTTSPLHSLQKLTGKQDSPSLQTQQQQQALHQMAQQMLIHKQLQDPGLQKIPEQLLKSQQPPSFQARQDPASLLLSASRTLPDQHREQHLPASHHTPLPASAQQAPRLQALRPQAEALSAPPLQQYREPAAHLPQQDSPIQIPFQSRLESACFPQSSSPRLDPAPHPHHNTRQEGLELRPDIASLPPQVQPRAAESAASTSQQLPPTPLQQAVHDSSVTKHSALPQPVPSSHKSESAQAGSSVESKVKLEDAPQTVDHVESMLENMFQQDDTPTPPPRPICDRRSPELTEDKVVEILQDRDSPIKSELKEEIKLEPTETTPTPQKNNAFMQVESELEKMFAGIVETPGDSDKPETPESSKSSKKSSTKRKGRPRNKKRDSELVKKQRNKSPNEYAKLKRRFGPKVLKEGSNDSSILSLYKSRGPLIRVSRDKEGRPATVTIVNSSSADEDRDRSMEIKMKRKAPRIIEGRTKGPGLFSSTLSSKYNSNTIDVTWTCVFCNRRSHCENGLGGEPAGDLYGPYLVHIKVEPLLGGPSDADVASEQRKRGGGKQLSLRAGGQANHAFTPPSKKMRKASVTGCEKDAASSSEGGGVSSSGGGGAEQQQQLQRGSSSGGGSSSGVVSREVWVHEACAVWSPGVILVGPHLIGLDDAVSLSLHSKCSVCGESGACIPCLQHGCHRVCHYGCARATQWSLDEQTFHARCLNHKKPITMSLALHQNST